MLRSPYPQPITVAWWLTAITTFPGLIRRCFGNLDSLDLRPGRVGGQFWSVWVPPLGLDGVDMFPALLEELARRGWNEDDLGKVGDAGP